jgi:UDP-2-acetamido-2-deoxy-ribo-hexuluronate aminotransferase
MSVPFYSYAASATRDWPRLERRLREVIARGEYVAGPAAAELESAIRDRTGARHAVACNSASDAIIVMLRACGIGPGDEVIVPAYTFFSTASSVLHAGAKPVLVDVLPGSFGMSADAAEAAITARTRAIMPAHMFSQMADIARLAEVASRNGVQLLEDSAEAIGMRMGTRHAGRWGRAGVLSFFPAKTLGAFGDAGMLITDDDDVAARARALCRHGQFEDGVHAEIGYNSRLDEVQACVLLTRLERLDEEISRRAELAGQYTAGLAGIPQLEPPWLAPAKEPGNQVWYVYLIEADRRDELVAYLDNAGIGTEVYYPRPLTQQPCLREFAGWPVPVADAAARRAVALPLYPDLTDARQAEVIEAIQVFYQGADG